MVIAPDRVHVCFGTPPEHYEALEKIAAGEDDIGWWTINKSALPGDQVIFYMVRPLSAFVATGVVTTEPLVEEDKRSAWYGHYGPT